MPVRSYPPLCISLLLIVAAFGSTGSWAKPRVHAGDDAGLAALVTAQQAFQSSSLKALEASHRQLAGDPLQVWTAYWLQRLALKSMSDPAAALREVRSFGRKYDGHPLAERLAQDWTKAVIERSEDPFTEPSLKGLSKEFDTPGLRCVRAEWREAREPARESGLDPALAALIDPELNTPGCRELALALVREGRLLPSEQLRLARWAALQGRQDLAGRLIRSPEVLRKEDELLELLSLSKRNLPEAARQLDAGRGRLTPDQRRYATLAIGSRLWIRTDPRAAPWIREGLSTAAEQPSEVLESAARQLLRANDWKSLELVLGAMPPVLIQTETWQYWKARLLDRRGDHEAARLIDEQLSRGFGFYSRLSAEQLRRPLVIPPLPEVSNKTLQDLKRQLAKHPSLSRSFRLAKAGLRAESSLEWSGWLKGRPESEILAAAQLASEAGHTDRSIAAAALLKELQDHRLRFPTPHVDAVRQSLPGGLVDGAWVYGVMRQESRFVPDIASSVGAKGLMQLMPATARGMAKAEGLNRFVLEDLTKPEVNIRLGSRYLSDMSKRFDGSRILATAAYNAGPGRSLLWRASLDGTVPGPAFVESIPFKETRDYVKAVSFNAVVYSALLDQGPSTQGTQQSLTDWLGLVSPASR